MAEFAGLCDGAPAAVRRARSGANPFAPALGDRLWEKRRWAVMGEEERCYDV